LWPSVLSHVHFSVTDLSDTEWAGHLLRETPIINFYEETDQAIDKVLDIFIRVNSGGACTTALSSWGRPSPSGASGAGRRYLVQWFEQGRLEYHPERVGTRCEVALGLVGLQALRQRGW
jgi:hypothetical protein